MMRLTTLLRKHLATPGKVVLAPDEACSERKVKVHGQDVIEYYHRGVICHLIGFDMAVSLDVEMLQPGEGEIVATKRLLERVLDDCGRFLMQ
jgi:hypothetical protein